MNEHHDKNYWLNLILKENERIVTILSTSSLEQRDHIAENLITNLRHFIQNIQCYIRECYYPKTFEKRQIELDEGNNFCKKNSKYNFLANFLDNLNASIGHQSITGEFAERLMQKYYYYLIKVKCLLKNEYSIDVLKNIEKYPVDLDNTFLNYYRKIIKVLSENDFNDNMSGCDQYYVQKKKPFYVDGVLFYEYTLSNANDTRSKFDRFIAFSLIDIFPNYSIKAKLISKEVLFLNLEISYFIIVGYQVSVRPCELSKIAKIVGIEQSYSRSIGYLSLMNYIKKYEKSLLDIVRMGNEDFENFTKSCFPSGKEKIITDLLRKIRIIVLNKYIGWKTISYLISTINNSIIKKQLPNNEEDSYDDRYLSKKTYSFEKSPFTSGLVNHIPAIKDLLEIFNPSEHRGALIARMVSNCSNQNGIIYLSLEDVGMNIDKDEIKKYNLNFSNNKYSYRKIIIDKKGIYLKENEDNTKYILKELIKRSQECSFTSYRTYAENRIDELNIEFDDINKKTAIMDLFSNGNIFVVYGPAGSGKSYFASKALLVLGNINKVCVAVTHPAVENMRKKIGDSSATYLTLRYYLNHAYEFGEIDVLVIDECSTVSASDMCELLQKTNAKYILLMGDVFQIQPITFGNWFNLLNLFIPKERYIELNNQFRSKSEVLKRIWDETRRFGKSLQELLSTEEVSHNLDNSIFEKKYDDEIILCLNYDGLYGINNINKMLQNKNDGKMLLWKQYTFKVGDPILFNDSDFYSNVFYNNLKGTIVDLEEYPTYIYFKVKVNTIISSIMCDNNGIDFYNYEQANTIVGFKVGKYSEKDYDSDMSSATHMPFQVAYAVSIHKAQGLEYDSVKIVISNEVEELITHNIFYTAITRAKRHLTIYWSTETENKIISSFQKMNINSDANKLCIDDELAIIK